MSAALALAVDERNEAMARAEAGASDAWKEQALALIRSLAEKQATVTSDDVWLAGLEQPREPRALGPIMVSAAKNGIIEITDGYKNSVRRHATRITVWKSLVYSDTAHGI